MLEIDGVTHWSIGVKNLEDSEAFYRDLLGLEYRGRLGGSRMACVAVGGHNILLCESPTAAPSSAAEDSRVHHAFEVSPDMWERAAHLFHERGVKLAGAIVYRERGFFTGREMYFLDPSGNVLELRDATWKPGMPRPTFEEIVQAASPA